MSEKSETGKSSETSNTTKTWQVKQQKRAGFKTSVGEGGEGGLKAIIRTSSAVKK